MVRTPENPEELDHSNRYQPDRRGPKPVVKTKARTSPEEMEATPEEKRAGGALGKAMTRLLTGDRPETDQGRTLQQRAKDLIARYGDNKSAAARAAGIGRDALRRASEGAKSREDNAEAIEKADRAHRVRPRVRDRVKQASASGTGEGGKGLGFFCRVKISQRKEDRWIYPGRWAEEGLEDIDQVYIDQGLEGVQDRMQTYADNYVSGMEIEEVTEIEY